MYRVWFTFRNDLGEDVRAYLDNNGAGFEFSDALDVAEELKAQGNTRVTALLMGGETDREEMHRYDTDYSLRFGR